MKMLKCILAVYLTIFGLLALGLFICFPILLSNYYKNENYLYLMFLNMPVLFGVGAYYLDKDSYMGRPTRPIR